MHYFDSKKNTSSDLIENVLPLPDTLFRDWRALFKTPKRNAGRWKGDTFSE